MYGTYRKDMVLDLKSGPVGCVERGPHGVADAPVVLFVHGFLVDRGVWGEVPELLAALGYRTVAPTLPLGAHPTPMRPDAELSPMAVARLVHELMADMDLHDITLVGNDTGGAICQLAVSIDHERVGRMVLTNCDAFEVFPPRPFDLLFRAGRHPRLLGLVMQATRVGRMRTGLLGFGLLVRRRLTGQETLPWVESYYTLPGVRRDVARFLRGWDPQELLRASQGLRDFDRPTLLAWAPEDRFFKIALAHRLLDVLPDAELVEVADARTFVALDQPARLSELIHDFVGRRA